MVTTTTSLLHDIEEYFLVEQDVPMGKYPRLHPTSLLRRAHAQLVTLDDNLEEAKKNASPKPFGTNCDCWRMLDDNDDT